MPTYDANELRGLIAEGDIAGFALDTGNGINENLADKAKTLERIRWHESDIGCWIANPASWRPPEATAERVRASRA